MLIISTISARTPARDSRESSRGSATRTPRCCCPTPPSSTTLSPPSTRTRRAPRPSHAALSRSSAISPSHSWPRIARSWLSTSPATGPAQSSTSSTSPTTRTRWTSPSSLARP
eukprot:Amastigsp_a509146_101.p5 type:complete len:113 gc:universal Amastigsp_a509146_101:508-170(-)